MTSEFDLIKQHFIRPHRHTASSADLGIGDDAALMHVSNGMQLAVSTDMLVAGTHFLPDCAAYDIGWKVLAVSISDMAAMGAQAKWATMAIALPTQLAKNQAWLSEFSAGFFACAHQFSIDLIGGDTTRGPLNISITIMGEVPIGAALRRDGAKAGDDIWVSGSLGDAALALAIMQQRYAINNHWLEDELSKWLPSLNKPQPRVALGLALRGLAHSCIDISDGLLADLGHILAASHLSATIQLEQLPISLYNKNHLHELPIQHCVLAGGDDYELCFTAPKSAHDAVIAIGKIQNLSLTCIGQTSTLNTDHDAVKNAAGKSIDSNVHVFFKNKPLIAANKGFNHFG